MDTTFNPSANNTVFALALQADGRILVGGQFTTLGGESHGCLGRLTPDGSLDGTVTPTAGPGVFSLALQADGGILAAGNFTSVAMRARARIARLTNSYPAVRELTADSGNVSWYRSAASPEIGRATCEVSTNGTDWTALGEAFRVGNTWQWRGLTISANVTIRARGFGSAGYQCGSSFYVESSLSAPAVSLQPTSRTNGAGTVASFSVLAAGDPPLGYQWYRGGSPLQDTGNLLGSRTAMLTLTNVLAINAGSYQVVITNSSGSVTSRVATLNVLDPFVSSQPTNRVNQAGTTATFSVRASGTSPLVYQWCKDGVSLTNAGNISGARTSTVTLSNVLGADAGAYSVLVTDTVGMATSSVAVLAVVDPAITGQPTNQFVNLGQIATFSVTARGTSPLGYQWRKAGAAMPGANTASLTITNVQEVDRGAYDVVVTNSFGSATSVVATLTVNLALADAFNPGTDGIVLCLAIQPDSKILVSGTFATLGGQPRRDIGRLNAEGSVDPDFRPAIGGSANVLAVQTDAKIIVGGTFSSAAGQPRENLCRFNPDGSLDPTFDPGAGGWVSSLAVQADGRILVGGNFTSLAGQARAAIGRLNPDGTLDSSFTGSAYPAVFCMALQPDGKILVGGSTRDLSGQPCSYLGRMNPDGTRDMSFSVGANRDVYCLAVQRDGKILVGGDFTTLAGQSCGHLGRLRPDGALEGTFSAGANDYVKCVAIQADGKILVSGWFTTLGGQPRKYIGRFNPDGTLDLSFNPGAEGGEVTSLAVQADGSILAGGAFTRLAGQSRNNLARLINTSPATSTLAASGFEITWVRGGSAPEFWRTSFEISTDNTNWISLGSGTPTAGGWRLAGVSLPAYATLRARGFIVGGATDSTSWFAESLLTLAPTSPIILVSDGNLGVRSSRFGFNYGAAVGQMVVVEGSTNLASWTPLATNTLGLGPACFSDSESGPWPHRFYRLRLK